jgi:hypothetical protein
VLQAVTCPDSGWEIERAVAGGSVPADRTRRAVLAATAASLPLLAVSGCKGVGALAAPPRPAPDVAVLRSAIAAEEAMIARYDAVISRSASLAGGLRPLRGEHRRHLAQLRSRLIVPPGSAAAASPSLSPSGQAAHGQAAHGQAGAGRTSHGQVGAGPDTVPADAAAAIPFLQAAERAAAAALLHQLAAASPSLAQLMASVAASEATHVAALTAAGGTGQA